MSKLSKEKPQQISLEVSNNELVLIESRTMRDEYVFKDTVMDKIKIVPIIPDSIELTIQMAANYYEVENDAIESIIRRNRQEFNEYGEVKVLKGQALKDFKALRQLDGNLKTAPSLTLITRRGLLRVGMMLTQSDVAKSIRNYLLNVEEIAPDEVKQWAIEREISKRERRRLTDSIQTFYQGSLKGKGFEYSTFTNLVYKVLWDTDASSLRKMYELDKNDPLRDSFSTEDLRKVVEVETAISSLIRLNKDYQEIKSEILKSKDNFN